MTTLDVSTDPRYRRLIAEYRAALCRYKNAAADRKRMRDHLVVRRSPMPQDRHWRYPVRSRRGFRIPQHAPLPPAPVSPPRERRIYLGDVLGFATIMYTPSVTWLGEPDPSPEVDQVYGEASRRLYWDTKAQFEQCQRVLLGYTHGTRTRASIRDAVGRRFSGVDDLDKTMEGPRREVEAACRRIWQLYERDDSEANMYLLLEGLADARFVGLESATVAKMERVVLSLASKGIVRRSH